MHSLMHSLKTNRLASTSTLPLLVLGAFGSACHETHRTVPVYQELESNDIPATANHLGVLQSGDRLLIEGVIGNPFLDIDGFSFVSGSAIHVDFQLFADRDLDVCLYDPEIDNTVACFATANHPEQGGVDVFGGGLEFHLIVEACIERGCFPLPGTPYTLELTVQPLFLATPTPETGQSNSLTQSALQEGSSMQQGAIRGVDAGLEASRDQSPTTMTRYKIEKAEEESQPVPDLVIEEHLEVILDEATGSTTLIKTLRAFSPLAEASEQ